MRNLAKAIQDKRQDEGLSQAVAASKLGIQRITLRLWELGASQPDLSNLVTLGGWLDMTVPEILMLEGIDALAGKEPCPTCGGTGAA